jgi:hypothetical protein
LIRWAHGKKSGDGATDHAKTAGRQLDPKFDHYTQNSPENPYKIKNLAQNNMRAQRFLPLSEI